MSVHQGLICLIGSVGLVTLFGATSAPAQMPERNANVWAGLAHQPARSDVREQESAHGILPPAPKRAQQDRDLVSICRSLMRASGDRGC